MTRAPAIRSVVFDADGVLVRAGVFAEILRDRYGMSREDTAPFFQGPFIDCVLGRADLKEAMAPFLEKWGWPGTIDECLRTWFEADSALDHTALEVVDRLRRSGLRCFVASTQEAHRARYLEDELGLADRFDGLFFSCNLGTKKPERAFYDTVAAQIDTEPEAILFLDDHEPNIEGARAAGWNAELYSIGDVLTEPLARYGLRA